jgi:hypothetical protein
LKPGVALLENVTFITATTDRAAYLFPHDNTGTGKVADEQVGSVAGPGEPMVVLAVA